MPLGNAMKESLACRMCEGRDLSPVGIVSGFSFLECSDCEFTFTPQLDRGDIRLLYGTHMEAPDGGWANPSFLAPAFERLGERRPLSLLDFGCGRSRLPDRLRDAGHRVFAIDTAPPRRPHRDRLVGDLLDLRLSPDQVAISYAFQVFEHLPHPRPYLEELIRLTRPGGFVVIHTDMHVPERDRGFERWWYVMPPIHCSFYRHLTFQRALERTPHELVVRDEKSVVIRVGPST